MKGANARENNIRVSINGKNMTPLVPVTPNDVAISADMIEDIKRGIIDTKMFRDGYTTGSIPARNICDLNMHSRSETSLCALIAEEIKSPNMMLITRNMLILVDFTFVGNRLRP